MPARFDIEILSIVGPTTVKKGKNTWKSLEVAFKKDGKIEGKKLVDFNNKDVFEVLANSKQGDFFSVVSEKDDNGYWQWTSVGESAEDAGAEASGSEENTPTPDPKPVPQRSAPGRVTGSNYETPEERALRRNFDQVKHRQIGRQGCLNTALTLVLHNSQGMPVSEDAVIDVAKKFIAFAFEDGVTGLKAMVDDIPQL